jgi:putative hydrolase of the HAD superfamily
VGWRKPHAIIFESALRTAGISLADAQSVMFVGDDFACDIEGPRALGFRVALYGSTECMDVPPIAQWSEFHGDHVPF